MLKFHMPTPIQIFYQLIPQDLLSDIAAEKNQTLVDIDFNLID